MYTNNFNNPIKAYLKKQKIYTVSIQTGMTQIENSQFLIQNPVLIEILKIIGVQNKIKFG